ncbi:MAG: flagellar biosynthesis anti-sigma factor FlgM [Sphingopyxis sp.]|nr:flagellar biosynthesis anti-sigma factor FlgM [Sphingopyxis sp.]
MAGDSKIGPVGGIGRTGPLRNIAGGFAASAQAPIQAQTAPDSLPTTRLTRLAGTIASQQPPVDVARVASLRSAIASGSYGVHPAIIASAMIDFYGAGAE